MIYLFLVPVLLGRGLALATLGCIQQPATSSEGAFYSWFHGYPVLISFFHIEQKIEKPVHPCGKTGLSGTPEGIRTPDLLVRSQTLYPAELLAHVGSVFCSFPDCLTSIPRKSPSVNNYF